MTSADTVTVPAAEPMLPVPYRVTSRTAETRDSVTLRLEPGAAAAPLSARPVHHAGPRIRIDVREGCGYPPNFALGRVSGF